MFWMKKNSLTLGLLASLVLLIHGCGGGGGGGGTAAVTSKSAAAGSKAIVTAFGAASLDGTNPPQKPSLKTENSSDEAQVRQALKMFKTSLSARKQKVLQAATDTGVVACNGGGTSRFQTNDNNTPNDFTDDSFSFAFNNCIENSSGISSFFNGSLTWAPTQNGFDITFDNFVSRITSDDFGNTESSIDGTMSFSGTEGSCGATVEFLNGTLTANLTTRTKLDLDKNGTFEFDTTSSLDNLTMTFKADCADVATFTLSGGITVTDHTDAANNLSATFTNFTMVMTPATVNGVDGDKLSLSGTITITSSCANGTFTLSTPAGQEPFIPEDDFCPVSGKFLISSGGSTTAVTYTETGGIQIDEGNNGSIDQSFPDCESAEVCNT